MFLGLLSLSPAPQRAHISTKAAAASTGWTTYHHDNTRNGYDAAATAFPASGPPGAQWQSSSLDGTLYAEPLAYGGVIYQATENNSIYAFNEVTGAQLWYWHKYASVPDPASAVGCGNINPVGITSTPVIDPAAGLIYAVGLVSAGSTTDKFQLFTVNLSNGTEAFAPIDIDTSLIDPVYEEQRAAIALAPNGLTVYVPFGGWVGDCTASDGHAYHPIVVAIPVATSRGQAQAAYQPQTAGQVEAGIWSASGPAIDASGNVYVSTGNGNVGGSSPCTGLTWDHGDGVIKLSPTVSELDYFAPTEWCALNASDNDIGSVGPMLLQNGQIFQSGKPGDWYLINSASLGHFGGQTSRGHVDSCPTSDAVFGGYAYAAPYVYVPCDGTGLVALQENTSVTPNTLTVAWQSSAFTPSAPIVAGGVVWTMDSNTLFGFDAVTGAQRFSVPIGGHTRFATPTEDNGWVIVPQSSTVHAFSFSWNALGGNLTSGPDAASWAAGHLDVFARGADAALWTRSWNGTTWGPWSSLGGALNPGDPGAVSGTANRVDVFVTGADGGLWHRWWNGTAWSAWEGLGGHLVGGPDAASWSATRLDVFVRGADNALWHRWWDGTAWQPWESLGGSLTSDPGSASSATNSIAVFVRGADNAIWTGTYNGTAWSGWQSLGGRVTSEPDASSCAAGHFDVFALGTDGALWRDSFNGTTWGGWTLVGGQWTSGPGVACQPTTTKIDLFERASDDALYTQELPN